MDHSAVDAVLLDLDGVITPTAEKHMQAWKEMFSEYFTARGVEPYTDEDYFRYLDGKPRGEGIDSLLAARGLTLPAGAADDPADADTVAGLGTRKNEVFLDLLARGIDPYPGSVRYLDALDAAGIGSAVVSSSRNARGVLAAAGLADRFEVVVDGVVAAERGLPGKPRPDTYTHAAELLGVPTARCVVVEDAESGVQAGAAGDFAHVVGVDRGTGRDRLRAAGADVVVDDLGELVADVRQVRR